MIRIHSKSRRRSKWSVLFSLILVHVGRKHASLTLVFFCLARLPNQISSRLEQTLP